MTTGAEAIMILQLRSCSHAQSGECDDNQDNDEDFEGQVSFLFPPFLTLAAM
jgi:hypothetical protein